MSAIDLPRDLPLGQRLLFSVPLLGRIAKEVTYGDSDNIYYAIAAGLSLWGIAILLFGIPGLYIPALALVPVIWTLLILISRG
ncbi:hypothetical protein OEZ49_19875 [Ruegeria sp. WL0004]|uniref:Uncharacterized protein n=1 Tax=Ruegeria marisflavi TaxID=2984152 RepID=A0ABT2WVV6_9RHOB|nr:hypothetical protein [Ruegeria sp. WL0004]MCU9840030.1 hypothetical protein [Ruegeria sp. WL0004]